MNKKLKLPFAIIVVGALLVTSSVIGKDRDILNAQPGDAKDPLVTKGYVDKQIEALKTELGKGGSNVGGSNKPTDEANNASTDSSKLKIVTIKPGQMLVGKAGAEFVIRAGKAAIYSPDANGVSDLTDGVDLTQGMSVANNHLLLFPREGRGITAMDTPKNQVVVAVRGGYEVKQAVSEEQVQEVK